MAVLAAVGEGEAGGVAHAGPGPVHQLRDEGQGADGLGAHSLHAQKALEVLGLALVGLEEDLGQLIGMDVAGLKVMGYIEESPFAQIKNIRLPQKIVQPYTAEEIGRLLACCDTRFYWGARPVIRRSWTTA